MRPARKIAKFTSTQISLSPNKIEFPLSLIVADRSDDNIQHCRINCAEQGNV